MSLTRQQLLTEALSLDSVERERLADELLASLNDEDQAKIDAAWLAETKSRDAAYARGEFGGAPVDEVIARILGKVGQ